MSWQASSWVAEHAAAGGSDLLTLMMLANEANSEGLSCWPGMDRLAAMTRMSVGGVRKCIEHLEVAGEVLVWRPATQGRGKHNYYALRMGREIGDIRQRLLDEVSGHRPEIEGDVRLIARPGAHSEPSDNALPSAHSAEQCAPQSAHSEPIMRAERPEMRVNARSRGAHTRITQYLVPCMDRHVVNRESPIAAQIGSNPASEADATEEIKRTTEAEHGSDAAEHLAPITAQTAEQAPTPKRKRKAKALPDSPDPDAMKLAQHVVDRFNAWAEQCELGMRYEVTATACEDARLLLARGPISKEDGLVAKPVSLDGALRLVDYVFDHPERNAKGFCWADQIRSASGLRQKYIQLRVWAQGHRAGAAQVASAAATPKPWERPASQRPELVPFKSERSEDWDPNAPDVVAARNRALATLRNRPKAAAASTAA